MANTHSAASHRHRTEPPPSQAAGVHWRRWFIALLLVAALVFAVLHWGDVTKFASLIGQARPIWLAGALLLQFATYVFLSIEWKLVLRAGGHKRAMRKLLPITISKLFADQVVPTAGMSGNVLLVDRLTAIDVPRRHAVAAVILAIIGYYLSYAICAIAAVVMLWRHGGASLFAVGIVGLFLAVAVAIPCAALWLQHKGRGAMPGWLTRFASMRELFEMIGEAPRELVRSPRLIGELALLNGAVFLIDAATMLVCLLAVSQPFSISAAYVPFIMASIVVTLGPIPLGLGSFEAVSVGMMRLLGVPFEAAVSATLLFRGFTLWLPLVAGGILMRGEYKKSRD
jgi:glycosyltransferase 2 family protein